MFDFLAQVVRNTRYTGAVCPSSPALGKVITAGVRRAAATRTTPLRVLEIGPGTGVFTAQVLDHLRDGDAFHIVEINNAFCRRLETRLLQPFGRRRPGVAVALHCTPIEDADLPAGFDAIVCGLPFNNFTLATTRAIFSRMLHLLNDDGELAYFEYLGVRRLKAPLVNAEGRRRLRQHAAVRKVLGRRYEEQRETVLANVPPARVVRLRAPASTAGPASSAPAVPAAAPAT